MVAEGDVRGPLFGRHVAAVLRRYFIDVRDVWAFRDLLLRDGYWELLDTPEGATTPNKRLTTKGRMLGATVPARLTINEFNKELKLPITGANKTFVNDGRSTVTLSGAVGGSQGVAGEGKKVIRQVRENAVLLAVLTDHYDLEKYFGCLPTALSDLVFQKHLSVSTTTIRTWRLKASKRGWIDFVALSRRINWATTEEGRVQLKKAGIKPTLTPEEIERWSVKFSLRNF